MFESPEQVIESPRAPLWGQRLPSRTFLLDESFKPEVPAPPWSLHVAVGLQVQGSYPILNCIDRAVRQVAAMVVDGDALRDLVHVDGRAAVHWSR